MRVAQVPLGRDGTHRVPAVAAQQVVRRDAVRKVLRDLAAPVAVVAVDVDGGVEHPPVADHPPVGVGLEPVGHGVP